MKMCMPHWGELRKAIDDRGLSPLVARSGKEAAESAVRQIEGTDDKKADFDPLMSANWAIMGRALELGGLYLMGADDKGEEYCPLCEVDKHGGKASDWITGCCNAQLDHARELGLVPVMQ